MTRWARNDLIGKLKKEMEKGGEQWEEIKLPAIDKHEKALWPEKYSYNYLDAIRKRDEFSFGSLYQQDPREDVHRILDDPKFGEMPEDGIFIAYFDPAMGGRDTSAFVSGCIWGGDFYIKQGVVWNLPLGPFYYDQLFSLYAKSRASPLYIEDNVAQQAIIDVMKTKGLSPEGVTSLQPKHLRISKNVVNKWKRIIFSYDVEDAFMDQILNYEQPLDLKQKRDKNLVDAPDALAGLIAKLENPSSGAGVGSFL